MNNKKVLSAAILLILAKSALAIEVEPNNDSSKANSFLLDQLDLILKNVGQLNKGSDVDFFELSNSCFKYTDTTSEHKKGECVKYKESGDKFTISEEKSLSTTNTPVFYSYPTDISLSFTCNNRALQTGQELNGWYLGIHDVFGVLQETYQIKPEDCTTGTTTSKGPYSVKFPMLLPTSAMLQQNGTTFLLPSTTPLPTKASDYVSITGTNLSTNSKFKYNVSVVGDCHIPVYNTNPANYTVTINDIVRATPATQAEISAASAETAAGKTALTEAQNDLINAEKPVVADLSANPPVIARGGFVLIGANAQIADMTDALALTTDIVASAIVNSTPATTINAATSAATASKVLSWAISAWVGTHNNYLQYYMIANDPAVQAAIDTAESNVTKAEAALTAAKGTPGEAAAQIAKDNAELEKTAAENAKKNQDAILSAAKTLDDDALEKVGEAHTALINAVQVLNNAVNASIKAAQASTAIGSRSNSLCDFANTATYTLEANKPSNQPYEDIIDKKPLLTLNETNNSRIAQTSSFYDVDFFKVEGLYNFEYRDNLPQFEFSCTKNSTSGSAYGWYVSVWKHNTNGNDTKQSGFEIVPEDCIGTTPYKIISPKADDSIDSTTDTYFLTVQSACASFPTTTESTLDFRTTFEGGFERLECNVNTTNYTLKFNGSISDPNSISPSDQLLQLKSELDSAIPLGTKKTGSFTVVKKVNPSTLKESLITDNYVVDSDGSNDIPLLFTCSAMAMRKTNDWKLSVYNDAYELISGLSSKVINGSDCGSGFIDDKGGVDITLPKGSTRYYLSIKPVSKPCPTTENSKAECVVDNSEYSISRDISRIYTGKFTAKSDGFKLSSCGLNSNAVITAKLKGFPNKIDSTTPINIQIGNAMCQVLTSESVTPDSNVGNVIGTAKVVDSHLVAKDTATLTLNECGNSNTKITLTGSKLDLVNFNPTTTTTTGTTTTTTDILSDSVSIPVKVSIGDFSCEAREAFYIYNDFPKLSDKTYSNKIIQKAANAAACTGSTCTTTKKPFFAAQ